MKAIFVESKNGYLAKGPADNMSWTPSLDKKLFRTLIFAFGGICVCSKHTYSLLPSKMKEDPNRTYIIAQRSGPNSLIELNKMTPNAVLVGGPAFLSAAYNLGVVDTFIITTVNTDIKSRVEYKNPFCEILPKPATSVNFSDMIVRIYNISKGDR